MTAVRLADIANVAMGTAPPGSSYNETGEGVALIAGAGDFGAKHPEPKKWTTQPSRISELGDLLVCVRATIGDLNWADRKYCLGRGVAGVRVDSGIADSGYVAWFLDAHKQQLAKLGTGSTFPAIRRADLEDFPIYCPPLPVQKRIAAILDAADALRAKRRESIEQLDSLVQATFLEMFGDPVANPKGWPVESLDAACDTQVGFAFPSKDFTAAGSGRALCRGINVGVGALDWNERKDWAKASNPKIDKYELEAGDIVLAMDRPWISSGLKIAIVSRHDLPALLVQRVCRIRCRDAFARPLVYRQLVSSAFRQHCTPTETTIPHISPTEVKGFPLIMTPLDLQTRFASIVESIEQQKARQKAYLAELDALFASLQSRAFNGELVA